MNRKERRAQGHRGPYLVGDGIIAKGLGKAEPPRPMAQLPEKVEGKHRWVASVAYIVSERAVIERNNPDLRFLLDNENMLNIALGCFDCEQVLGEITEDSYCPGDPTA